MSNAYNQSTLGKTSDGYKRLMLYSRSSDFHDINLLTIPDSAIEEICHDHMACATLMVNARPNTVRKDRKVLKKCVCESKFAESILVEGNLGEASPWYDVCEKTWWQSYWWAAVLIGAILCIVIFILLIRWLKKPPSHSASLSQGQRRVSLV